MYFLYGESVIYYFKHIVLVDKVLLPFAVSIFSTSFPDLDVSRAVTHLHFPIEQWLTLEFPTDSSQVYQLYALCYW